MGFLADEGGQDPVITDPQVSPQCVGRGAPAAPGTVYDVNDPAKEPPTPLPPEGEDGSVSTALWPITG
jgi:hypothetical protein